MNFNLHNHKPILIILFIIVILLEIIDLVLGIFSPSKKIVSFYINLALMLSTFILLILLLKGTFQTSKELNNSNQNLNSIFDSLDVAIWSHDLTSNILLITPGIEKLYGHTWDEFYNDKQLWKKVIYPDDLSVLEVREKQLNSGAPCTSVYRIIKPDGKVRWIQDRGIPTLDSKGTLVYFTSVLFDITDKKESEDLYRSLVEMSPDIITVISNEKFVYINESGSRLVGAASPSDLIDKEVSQFSNQEVIDEIKKKLEDGLTGDIAKNRFEMQVSRLDGQEIDVEVSIMPILYGGRPSAQIVGRDITTRKKAEKTIRDMAYYDSLTGIPNRNMFKKYLNESLTQSPDDPFAILFLDLDRFKVINDTKGHTIGDLILERVAMRLKEVVQNEGMVFRQGGDEFLIILNNIKVERVEQLAATILLHFSNPIVIRDQEFFVTPSIGISMYPTDGADQESLIKHADTAMYLAKEHGKNNFQFYYPDLDKITSRKMELENGLRRALELDQFTLYYQPKVHLATGKILGVEALLRWIHPVLGMIAPGDFIPLAEETGLIIPIGKWVLKKACEQSKSWEEKGIGTIPVAVNISMRQIKEDGFVEAVKEILLEAALNPSNLELEITESIMQDFAQSTVTLKQLKDLGLIISMDDFGTGYSSLNNLRHLPIDNIKIDKSFVDDIKDQSYDGSIVKAIINMGQNMNFNIIAEGIETKEQVEFLFKHSCEIGQGYYYSKPLPPLDFGTVFTK